jgi:hypothetical protein
MTPADWLNPEFDLPEGIRTLSRAHRCIGGGGV